ncbi:MAG TPA: hypothetical protein VEH48_00345 [Candidatus Nitrosopolaris sp.]|nr:hypothetical protein [Candidatus Nitrosopolaris sp.]
MTAFRHELLLHPRTQEQIGAFLAHPAHALLITGVAGSGKLSVARATAANLLGLEPSKLEVYPYYSQIQTPEGKQEISIDAIRELIDRLKLKTPGTASIRRVVVIENSQAMSIEAQNSILKTLEEPSAETVFILTAPAAKNVAPTIASRAQIIGVKPVARAAANDYYGGRYEQKQIDANWRLSGGAAGLLEALIKNSAEHPLKLAVDDFKKFLAADTYGRLLDGERLARDKAQMAYFLDAGGRVLRALQQTEAGQKRQNAITVGRKLILSLQAALQANANPRLVAAALALNLKL